MGRPPVEKKQRQFPVALPDEVRERLEAAAKASERSLAEEIRRRLNKSFEADTHDEQTRDLAYAVIWMAEELGRQTGRPWHSTRKSRSALAVAIEHWLEISGPQESAAVSDLFGPDDPPTLGRSIARHFQRFAFETRRALQLLRGERQP